MHEKSIGKAKDLRCWYWNNFNNILWHLGDFWKGRPKLCLWVTTVEHGRFRCLFYVFEFCITNHRRQKCAFVISFKMKTAAIQHYCSRKWLHCRHGVFQTLVNDFNVDLKIIDSFFSWNEMQISQSLSENGELQIFWYNALLKHIYVFRFNYESKNQHEEWRWNVCHDIVMRTFVKEFE